MPAVLYLICSFLLALFVAGCGARLDSGEGETRLRKHLRFDTSKAALEVGMSFSSIAKQDGARLRRFLEHYYNQGYISEPEEVSLEPQVGANQMAYCFYVLRADRFPQLMSALRAFELETSSSTLMAESMDRCP